MWAVIDNERRGAARPTPMLAEVTELFGLWHCSTYIFIGYIRGKVHDVRDVSRSYLVAFICIQVSPEDWRKHVGDAGSFRRFVVFCFVTVLDDLL